MNYGDALKTVQDFYEITSPTADDEFMYTEALGVLIQETKEPKYMVELGWYYSSIKRFDLEIKYLELAAESGYGPAFEELGYMWYYGQHGEKDYDKAFQCFSRGAERDKYGNSGSLWCRYKLADMYRYGLSVDKDPDKYRQMIEAAYEDVKNPRFLNEPFPEIALRLAGIRAEEGKKEEAVRLLRQAKSFLAERLSVDPFWGHINVMGRIVRFLYRLTPFNIEYADFYDLFHMTGEEGEYSFMREGRKYILIVSEEDGEYGIKFDGRWYRSFEEFCQKAELGGSKITRIYDEFYDLEVAE
ncbi:MAG: hypothetical protein K5989_11400 [Lachnospiraceae bacterium]|nr:hypothetical protein [Lachnospiraceae bacterium]